MSTQVQFRRGTTTQNNAFTGAIGEISVDTDLKTIRLHDGTTAGGGSIMLNNVSAQTALNKTFSTGSVWQGSAVGLGYGGTGSSLTAAAGAVPYSTASGLALNSPGTSGQILVSGGTGAPTWVAASSISAGTSTLATTATNIAGGSAGQLVIQADTGLSTFITAGASGTFLRSAGAGYAPTWATADVTIGTTVTPLGGSNTSLAGLNILAATGTSHWLIPNGTTAQRPVSPSAGMIRYNSDLVSFEGYSSGAWASLGGVSSVDKYTYIRAETSAGASNGELEFFAETSAGTAAVKVAGMNYSRFLEATGVVLGTQTTQAVFNTVATTVNAFGAATTLNIGATTGTLTVANTTLAAKAITASTTLGVTGAATLSSTLGVTGATTLSSTLAVTGDVNVNTNKFNVTAASGNTSVAGTLGVAGVTSLTNSTAATNATSGALVVTGGVGIGGATYVGGNLTVTGNLTINGTTTTVSSTSLELSDPLIYLGQGNSGNSADIGIVGHFTSGSYQHTGLVRSAANNEWRLFSGVTTEPSTTIDFTSPTYDALRLGNLIATGTLSVTGTSNQTGNATFGGTVAVTGTSTFTGKATLNGGADIVDAIAYDYNFTGTTSSTTATAITSFATATYRSGKLLMQVVNGTAYRVLQLFFVHDGTTVTLSENYLTGGEVQTGVTNTTFTATISAGTLTVYATAASGTSVVKGHATLFKV